MKIGRVSVVEERRKVSVNANKPNRFSIPDLSSPMFMYIVPSTRPTPKACNVFASNNCFVR